MTSQLKPLFITGATAQIKIGDEIIGYCINVNCRLDTPNLGLDVVGMYEPIAIVPTASSVFGGFGVIRYTPGNESNIPDFDPDGNSLIFNDKVNYQLEPKNFLKDDYFNLEVYKPIPKKDPEDPEKIIYEYEHVCHVRDCRIITRGFTLIKKSYLIDQYQFMGRLSSDEPKGIKESKISNEESNHNQWSD